MQILVVVDLEKNDDVDYEYCCCYHSSSSSSCSETNLDVVRMDQNREVKVDVVDFAVDDCSFCCCLFVLLLFSDDEVMMSMS